MKITKKEGVDTVVLSRFVFALIPTLAILPFFGIPIIGPLFWPAVIVACVLDVAATTLMIKALDHSAMSRSIPLLAFSPAFVLITGTIILGEFPTIIGIFGVLVVVLGAYVLKLKLHSGHHLEPFRRLVREKWARYMLVASIIMALAAPTFKTVVINSSPIFAMAVSFPICIAYTLVFTWIRREKVHIPTEPKRLIPLVLLGLSLFSAAILVNMAFVTGIASYIVSIKRLSIFFNVLIGTLIFKESHAKQSIIAGLIMVLGAIIIGLS